jgi:hypothetical protein
LVEVWAAVEVGKPGGAEGEVFAAEAAQVGMQTPHGYRRMRKKKFWCSRKDGWKQSLPRSPKGFMILKEAKTSKGID